MKKTFTLKFNQGLLSKLVLLVALFVGSSNAWGEDIIYFSNTSSTLTGWTASNITAYSYSPYYLYTNGNGTLTSDSPIMLAENRKLVISAKRYIGSSTNPSIAVKYSSDGETWSTIESPYTTVLETDNYVDLEVDLTGTYYIKLECYKIRIQTLKLSVNDPYPAPSNFSVSSTTATTATLSWEQAKNESAWQIAYSTKNDFNPNSEGVVIDLNENPSIISGLTSGVTYYAYIRSNYGGGQYSSTWSEKIEITPTTDITINDNNSTSYYIPIYGYKANYLFKSQFIIPKASLNDVKGQAITELTFYASQASVNWGTALFDVYLNEVANTTYATTPVFEEWGTKVYSNKSLSISENKMVISFDTPYKYNGGNLMIGFDMTTAGSSVTTSWYGVSALGNACYYAWGGSDYTMTREGLLPKITFKAIPTTVPVTIGDNGYTTFACPLPLDLANLPDGLTAYKAEVDAGNRKVSFTEVDQAVAANTGVLLQGDAGETYNILVADAGTAVDGNAFEVNSTGGTFAADYGYTYFGMKKDSDPLTFATFDPSAVAIPTGKAYLKVETSALNAGAHELFSFFDDSNTTGIQSVSTAKQMEDATIYNLNGQRIAQPSKGLFIVNGKKVVIK